MDEMDFEKVTVCAIGAGWNARSRAEEACRRA